MSFVNFVLFGAAVSKEKIGYYMRGNINSIIVFFFVVFYPFFVCAGEVSFMGVEMLHPVSIKVESNLIFGFESEGKTSLAVLKTGNVASEAALLTPALVRISGATVEIMIDIENNAMQGYDGGESAVIRVFDFKVLGSKSGASAIISPPSGEKSFVFSVGGAVSGSGVLNKFYTGVNILNINYL